MISEAPERGVAFKRYPVVLDDPAARKFASAIDITATISRISDKIGRAGEKVFRSSFWMDELLLRVEAGYPKNKKLPIYEFRDGDVWGKHYFQRSGSRNIGVAYWNAILDETGGPWAVSPVHGNPDPKCAASCGHRQKPRTRSRTPEPMVFAHFSKFVRPGALRVERPVTQKCAGDDFPEARRRLCRAAIEQPNENTDVHLKSNGKTLHLACPRFRSPRQTGNGDVLGSSDEPSASNALTVRFIERMRQDSRDRGPLMVFSPHDPT